MAQGPSHQLGISSGCIGQTEWHPDELVLSEWGGESCLLPVRALHRNRVKSPGPIKGRENPATGETG